jgi:hypothetical protein
MVPLGLLQFVKYPSWESNINDFHKKFYPEFVTSFTFDVLLYSSFVIREVTYIFRYPVVVVAYPSDIEAEGSAEKNRLANLLK